MFEETGFLAREEADDFLILRCPWCAGDITFTQCARPAAIRQTVDEHAGRCSDRPDRIARRARLEPPGPAETVPAR